MHRQIRRGVEQPLLDDATGLDLNLLGASAGTEREEGESDSDYRGRIVALTKITL